MRIGICDDLAEDRRRLSRLVNAYYKERGEEAAIEEFGSAEELLDAWSPGLLQILFLDVYMGKLSGVEAAKIIRETDADCAIIFTTTSEEHAIDSYAVHAADYLLKPFGKREVKEALDWCGTLQNDSLRCIEIISDREKVSVPLRSIVYIEVYGRVSILHTLQAEISTNMSLGRLEELIGSGDFLRCHRSYLVNMNCIRQPTGFSFLMQSGDRVPMSDDNAVRIKQAFFDWSFARVWEQKM